VLYKRKGNYKKSIELYLEVLIDLSLTTIVHYPIIEDIIEFNNSKTNNEEILKFDRFVLNMVKICSKYGSQLSEEESQDLWIYSLKGLYLIEKEVFKQLGEDIEEEIQENFPVFLKVRI